jgi:hypothetical protein
MRAALVALLCLSLVNLCLGKKLAVTVPESAKPGESLQITHAGVKIKVRVPEGTKPGEKIYVDVGTPKSPLTRKLNVTVPEVGLQ